MAGLDKAESNADMLRFWKSMIAFRKSHPVLGQSRFWRESVRWYGVEGAPDLGENSHSLAFFLDGSRERDDDLYVLINAFWEPLAFRIQEQSAVPWRRAVDTSMSSPDDFTDEGRQPMIETERYTVGARSVVVLVRPRAS